MDLSMLAGTPAPLPRLGTHEDGDDACVLCGYWTCRCTRQSTKRVIVTGTIRRAGGRTTCLTITPAGVTGSIRPAVPR